MNVNLEIKVFCFQIERISSDYLTISLKCSLFVTNSHYKVFTGFQLFVTIWGCGFSIYPILDKVVLFFSCYDIKTSHYPIHPVFVLRLCAYNYIVVLLRGIILLTVNYTRTYGELIRSGVLLLIIPF